MSKLINGVKTIRLEPFLTCYAIYTCVSLSCITGVIGGIAVQRAHARVMGGVKIM